VKTALVGSGSNTLKVGLAASGVDFLLSQTIAASASPAVGDVYGLTFSQLGTAFDSLKGYNAVLNAGQTIVVSLSVTGTVTTAPEFEVDVTGWLLGT